MAFLQETTFYVVEEGQLSDGWRSPLHRRLVHDADDLALSSIVAGNGTRGTKRNLASYNENLGFDHEKLGLGFDLENLSSDHSGFLKVSSDIGYCETKEGRKLPPPLLNSRNLDQFLPFSISPGLVPFCLS